MVPHKRVLWRWFVVYFLQCELEDLIYTGLYLYNYHCKPISFRVKWTFNQHFKRVKEINTMTKAGMQFSTPPNSIPETCDLMLYVREKVAPICRHQQACCVFIKKLPPLYPVESLHLMTRVHGPSHYVSIELKSAYSVHMKKSVINIDCGLTA